MKLKNLVVSDFNHFLVYSYDMKFYFSFIFMFYLLCLSQFAIQPCIPLIQIVSENKINHLKCRFRHPLPYSLYKNIYKVHPNDKEVFNNFRSGNYISSIICMK